MFSKKVKKQVLKKKIALNIPLSCLIYSGLITQEHDNDKHTKVYEDGNCFTREVLQHLLETVNDWT